MSNKKTLSIATWNVAAINNNPFEYWITIPTNPAYNNLMLNVEKFIENPGANDVSVSSIFTTEMYRKLESEISKVDEWKVHVPSLRKYWDEEYKDKLIISQFMKDKQLGLKRLTSMPDRITNTINTIGSDEPICRPTVINMYNGDLKDVEAWFEQYLQFFFKTDIQIIEGKATISQKPYEMLTPIKKSKYPAISVDEENMSLPLQLLSLSIFDCILVHMLNTLESPKVWQPLKLEIVDGLIRNKVQNTLDVITSDAYIEMDVVCIQEASGAFVNTSQQNLKIKQKFTVVPPEKLDYKRDQNSIILLSLDRFPHPTCQTEVTEAVEAYFPKGVNVPVAHGDLLVITTKDVNNIDYVIASFHGDTNGLATIPVLTAINLYISSLPGDLKPRLIFGLDANTYVTDTPGQYQGITEFADEFVKMGYTSTWGDFPDTDNYTTFNARTYLQTQLNKACKSSERETCGDVNPKDFILFNKGVWGVSGGGKDNTGNGKGGKERYVEGVPFPTLEWPSDHGLVWGALVEQEKM